MDYSELVNKVEGFDENELASFVSKVKDWALMHGIGMRSKNNFDESSLVVAPFTLLPSPITKDCFERAIRAQKLLNKLLHRLAYDSEFLDYALASVLEHDEFTRKLYEIYTEIRKTEPVQRVSLVVVRNDLMFVNNGIKQVEMNTIASGFGHLGPSSNKLHRYVVKQLRMDKHLNHIPVNIALSKLCEGLIEAWRHYNVESAVILFVVEEVTFNICDQRFMEFETERLNSNVRVIRRSFNQLLEQAKLGENMELYVDKHEVAVVYFRWGYDPTHFSDETWSLRLMMEKSKAIKCPSIQYHLVGAKKVQQVLCYPGILEKYISDKEEANMIRDLFVDIYPLDESPEGEEGYKLAMNQFNRFVLKPQREGGGNNIYGDDIPKHLKSISRKDAAAFILMGLIEPVPTRNILVKQGYVGKGDVVSELGIYGIIIGDDNRIYLNEEAGHMLRSKLVSSREGGVAAGDGLLDSPYVL
ncbi:glutathione synthetase isoform X2 [Halyomorpha halys]|uniref:glutathione synthetase isoform X2 n=1 Tax=Halyomorpha halys TaxID=286706 RepID=UPI0006D4D809|nr:glutathione synthetase-like isoform X1 [Halyomorpha halys]